MAGLGGGVGLARLARAAARLGARQRDGAGGAARARRRGAGAVPRVHHGQGQGGRARPVARRRPRPGRRGARGDGARRRGSASTPTARGRSTTRCRRSAASAAHDLEYAEQPCATVEELRDLRMALARNGIDVRIAADESIRKAEDPLRVRDLEAADIIVVKVAPLGGVRSALAVVEACGLPAVVSSALDTSVGISAGVALAAALPSLEHACGLGTVALLAGDVAAAPARAGRRRAAGRSRGRRPGTRSSSSPRLPSASRGGATGCAACAEHVLGGGPVIDIRWTWLFLDTPRGRRRAVVGVLVRGHRLAAVRHPRRRTTSSPRCCPPRGDAWLKVQAVADGPGGIHLDLDVDDVHAAAAEAERLGATRIGGIGEVVVILRSPGGLTFCLTPWHGDARAGARRARSSWSTRSASTARSTCTTPRSPSGPHSPAGRGPTSTSRSCPCCGGRPASRSGCCSSGSASRPAPVRAHADLACADRQASLARHLAAGAQVVAVRDGWTVMADPVGRVYCLTDRSPTAPPG